MPYVILLKYGRQLKSGGFRVVGPSDDPVWLEDKIGKPQIEANRAGDFEIYELISPERIRNGQ
jgi:hypothetical protein